MMCASADGIMLPPYVIYKSLHMYESWTKGGPKGEPCCVGTCCKTGTMYNHTPSGWFDMPSFEHWYINMFLPHATRIEGPKAVICDNLSSHLSPKVLRESKKNNISFICLPPNSTHLSQPLDVAFFAPMKKAWSSVLEDYKRSNPTKSVVEKTVFPKLLNKVLSTEPFRSKISENIRSGFKATGLHPLNKKALLKRLTDAKSTADLIRTAPTTPQAVGVESPQPSTSLNTSSPITEPLVTYLQKQRFSKVVNPTKRGKRCPLISPGKSLLPDSTSGESTEEELQDNEPPKKKRATVPRKRLA